MAEQPAPEAIPEGTEHAASQLIEAAFRVHRALGPGLLESVYETCVCHELDRMGVRFQRQLSVPVSYGEVRLETGLRLDLLVEGEVIAELKAVEAVKDVHRAQLLTYLKLTRRRLGFIINFNGERLKDGIVRMIL